MQDPVPQDDIAAISRISSVPTILKAVSELTGMGFSLVARVTENSWTACAVHDRMGFGLSVGGQLDLTTTLCKEVRDSRKPIIIRAAREDPVYCNHHTPRIYKIQSYISIPIFRSNGEFFGTLCAIDPQPAELSPNVIDTLTLFADLISRQLRAEEEREQIESDLGEERAISQLREQFIAVLGHDLRTPLSAIRGAAAVLAEMGLDPTQEELIEIIQESSQNMTKMIEELLDFARGRLGGGIPLNQRRAEDLIQIAQQAIGQLAHAYRDHEVVLESAEPVQAWVDPGRFRQLLVNLLSNALQHSPQAEPVRVSIHRNEGCARVEIANGGPGIPPDMRESLFQPFNHSSEGRSRKGLGLGLFIASEIARAHEGKVDYRSNPGLTVFAVELPLHPPEPA